MKKAQQNLNTPKISPNLTPKLDSKLSKTRQQINQENYQKNKERRSVQAKERYWKQKEQNQLITKQTQAKYYGAEAIKILMTFGEYTELNKEKKKLWLDFNWTLKDCQKGIKDGLGSIYSIMKLAQVADNLVRDYWETAKSEQRNKSKSWNSLDYDEQQRLIRYWGYEKARIENGYLDTAEQLERQSQGYLKEIKWAKFHEERGKIKCECYSCEEQKKIRSEVINEQMKIIEDYETNQKASGALCG